MNLGTKNQRFTLIWPNPGKWYWSLPWFYDSFFSNTPAESGSFDTWHKAVIDVFITKLPKWIYSSLMTVFCSRNSHTDRYGAYRFPPLPQNCLFHLPFHRLWAVLRQSCCISPKIAVKNFYGFILKIDAMYLWS